MMITFVSQCQKNAIHRTRKVLDSFANKIGDAVWQTVITKEGLEAVRRLLNNTATKNTAVSCHWQRSRSRSDLVWVVGKNERFNHHGHVPVNSTKKNSKSYEIENAWIYFPLIESLSMLAALFHDFGKASLCFQEKLLRKSKNRRLGDPLRHEWVSLLMFNAYVSTDTDYAWLDRLAEGVFDEVKLISIVKNNYSEPFEKLDPIASVIGWLILTHHRLPLNKNSEYRERSAEEMSQLLRELGKEWGYENHYNDAQYQRRLEDCLRFPSGLPCQSELWLMEVKKWANQLKMQRNLFDKAHRDGSLRLILQYARLSLMLGDHHYSSRDADPKWKTPLSLIANTYSGYTKQLGQHKVGEPKQKLDEHLVKVAKSAQKVLRITAKLESELPSVLRINEIIKKSPPKFAWQDKAVGAIKVWNQTVSNKSQMMVGGFFAVNMASTGCGKTLANAKIMHALAQKNSSFRYTLALGLRSLTLQTGDEYRERLKLTSNELAVMIGSKAVVDLHQKTKDENTIHACKSLEENSGSESIESLLSGDDYLDYSGEQFPEFNTILSNEKERRFLYAPILACTIDHIISATECSRGGRYILPMLRMMSSDLVIDEVDDFDPCDLVAISRLIHLAGMLGRKVMVSSATIPPDLAIGYFNAYREGWLIHATSRGLSKHIGCAWIDEHGSSVATIKHSAKSLGEYQTKHAGYAENRAKKLLDQPKKRVGKIVSCHDIKDKTASTKMNDAFEMYDTDEQKYFSLIQMEIIHHHSKHAVVEEESQKIISFGVVRVANIDPCVELALFLAEADWPADTEIRVMPYHSRQVLLLRSEQEKHLNEILNRKDPDRIFKNDIIKSHISRISQKNIIFIAVTTPVEEVGRDHDFDWAVIEPSSYRSIIQMAGRVLRHREHLPVYPNVSIMQFNLKGLKGDGTQIAFYKPGFERSFPSAYKLNTHRMEELVDIKSLDEGITAIPRIIKQIPLKQNESLVDLEHFTMQELMTQYDQKGPETIQGWLTQFWWLTALPQSLNRFRHSNEQEQVKLKYRYSENEFGFYQKNNATGEYDVLSVGYDIKPYSISDKARSRLWLDRDYLKILKKHAISNDGQPSGDDLMKVSEKYGEIMLPLSASDSSYVYCDAFGLWKGRPNK